MKVPYLDLQADHSAVKTEILEAVSKVIDRANFIGGEEVVKFEEHISRRLGSPFVIAVNSGTDALFLPLKALGIGPGDEVITVSNSFLRPRMRLPRRARSLSLSISMTIS